MTSRAMLPAAVGLLLAALLAGCSPTPAPSPTATIGFSTEAEAFAAAEETYRAYVDALNAVDLSDPETFEEVYAWTTGDLNASDRKGLTAYHADGVTVDGESIVRSVALGQKSVSGVELDVCLDVSDIAVLDASGASLVDDDRANVQSLTISLTRDAESPTGLNIESIGPREGEPSCDS